MKLRLSITTLESFRLFQTTEWMTEERLLDQLTGKFESNPAMTFGSAYHRLIEKGFEIENGLTTGFSAEYPDQPKIDFLNVSDKITQPALDFRLKHPLISNEYKVVKNLDILGHEIQLVAKCDGLEGAIIHEHKTTPNVDYDKYYNSYQWRFYCDIFGLDIVQYNVFELVGSAYKMKKATNDQEFINEIESVELQEFQMFNYPDLHKDCEALLIGFIQFIELKELASYFPHKLTRLN